MKALDTQVLANEMPSAHRTIPVRAKPPRRNSRQPYPDLVSANVRSASISNDITSVEKQEPSATSVPPILGMKKWEGRILAINDEIFSAELTPLDHSGPTVHADFHTSLFGPDETAAEVGGLVYLTVRTIKGAGGYPYRTEHVKLRRLGKWAEADLEEAKRLAEARWGDLDQYME